MTSRTIRAWGLCTDCGFEGVLEYSEVAGESYTDPDAGAVVLLLHCTACGSRDNALVPFDYYQEISQGKEGA